MAKPLFVYGGPIYTMAAAGSVESMLVVNGRVAATGSKDALMNALPRDCQHLDLAGRAVYPGMHDSHMHLNMWAIGRRQVDLKGVGTLQQGLDIIRQTAEKTPGCDWIVGSGWDKSLWINFPDREDLDRVSMGHPIYLASKDGHSIWVNTRALEISGVDSDTAAPPGGAILKDGSGRLTGILQDTAQVLVDEHLPNVSEEQWVDAIADGMGYLHSLGLTGIHNVDGVIGFTAAQTLQERGLLDMRLAISLPLQALKGAAAAGLRQGFGNDHVFLGPIKMFKDGALGSSTAWMLDPYTHMRDNYGLDVMPNDELIDAVTQCVSSRFGAAVHAIGDRACREVLDAMEKSHPETSRLGLRHRIEHSQLLTEQDVLRYGRLGVIASVQPSHAVADRSMADREWGDRARWAYPFETLRRTGAVLAFGSDAPVDDPNPIYGIHCAVNRYAPGEPETMSWYPQERLSVMDSIRAYTVGAAYSVKREGVMGDLSPGKYADFVVLSRDLTTIPTAEIMSAKVEATAVGGKSVFGPNW